MRYCCVLSCPLQASSPYTASLYKDNSVTVRNVSTVDGDGFNLTEQAVEGEREREMERERERLFTSDTFKLGWLDTPPVERDTQGM